MHLPYRAFFVLRCSHVVLDATCDIYMLQSILHVIIYMLHATLHRMQKKSTISRDFHPRFLLSPYTMSDLQKKILTHVCTTYDASYESLIEDMKKDRITIMQSLRSLINYHYVDKRRINPEFEKSKVIFFPTLKGKAFAHLHLNVDLTDMIKVGEQNNVEMYIEFIKQAFPLQYDRMLSGLLAELEQGLLETDNTVVREKNLVIRSFLNGILNLAPDSINNYADFLSNKRSLQIFENLFSKREIQETKKYLQRARRNLDLCIDKFPP